MITYIQYPRNRKEEFKLITGFEELNGKKHSFKKASSKTAEAFLNSLLEKRDTLTESEFPFGVVQSFKKNDKIYFHFIAGSSLDNIICNLVKDGHENEAVEVVNNYIKTIKSLVSNKEVNKQEAIEFFGTEFKEHTEWIWPGIIDLDFGNFIQNDKEITLIDYEWTFDFPVPFDYVIFRALNNLVIHSFGGRNIFSQKLYDIYKTYLREDLIIAEHSFQSYVVKNPPNRIEFIQSHLHFSVNEYRPYNYFENLHNEFLEKQRIIEDQHHQNEYMSGLLKRRSVKIALKVSNLLIKIKSIIKKLGSIYPKSSKSL